VRRHLATLRKPGDQKLFAQRFGPERVRLGGTWGIMEFHWETKLWRVQSGKIERDRTIGLPSASAGHEEGNLPAGTVDAFDQDPSTSASWTAGDPDDIGIHGQGGDGGSQVGEDLVATHGGDVHPRRERAEAPGRVAIRQITVPVSAMAPVAAVMPNW